LIFQAEYEKEGVNWKKITFIDNQDIIDLLARGRMSIISMIDEEMIVPQGSDQTLCAKLQQQHGKHKHFITPSSRQVQKSLLFGVKHFAGPVSYDCLSMLFIDHISRINYLSFQIFLKKIVIHLVMI
jgi:myosin heavy subunit